MNESALTREFETVRIDKYAESMAQCRSARHQMSRLQAAIWKLQRPCVARQHQGAEKYVREEYCWPPIWKKLLARGIYAGMDRGKRLL